LRRFGYEMNLYLWVQHIKILKMNNIHLQIIAKDLNIPLRKVESTVALLVEGATIPFIARYRKELTGSLDEVQIADIWTQYQKLQELEKRREAILKSMDDQGKLTDDLRKRIVGTYNLTELEDIYLPFKPKRKTRASIAKERGLEPLADAIVSQKHKDVQILAKPYLNEQVPTEEDALQGARDILAERVNEDERARMLVRQAFEKKGLLHCKVVKGKEDEGVKYKDYFKSEELLSKCPSHRLLAIRRGEEEGFLRVSIAPDEDEVIQVLSDEYVNSNNASGRQVLEAVKDSYERLLSASIETEFKNKSKEKADEEAINVFINNLRQLLMAAPLGQKRVMGLDPGFRTGCKTVCLSDTGDLVYNDTIYPHLSQNQTEDAAFKVQQWVKKFQIQAIAIGNGTAGRETESFIRGLKFDTPVTVFMVNEAGASIYSASEVARTEFPDLDLTVRGAVSIGRRLMDPLAELVKIDAKSIGVGQYQHDVNQTMLKSSLDRTVESCVNTVGVNLNTASKHLLTYISGLGPALAQNIVNHRTEIGLFKSRNELKKVTRLGAKAFEQAAGFLRIRNGAHPLDNTAVHPESYHIVEKMATDLQINVNQLIADKKLRASINLNAYVSDKIGLPTLNDIMKELDKPGLDPRGEAKSFAFADGIRTLEDLRVGMIVPGIVTNITNFGAFVDIGVKQDGLVHVSQLANRFVRNPNEVVKLQQIVEVKIIELDRSRKRVMLSMKDI
jgi:protein Tex